MDTPEKTQIGNHFSKFEDSPVFNYINSLSPIKPVKSIHITQSFNSITFASPPSVFTSPHVSSQKESRFLRRHNCPDLPPDLPKPVSSDNGKKICPREVVGDATRLYDNTADLHENFKPMVFIGGAPVEQSSEHSRFSIELPSTLKYDCGSPDSDPTLCCGTVSNSASQLAGSSASLVPLVQEASEKGSLECEAGLENMCQTEQRNEGTGCDWESLISDAADLLIFNSPGDTDAFKGLMGRPMDPGTIFHTSLVSHYSQDRISNAHKMQLVDPVGFSEQQQTKDPSSLIGETDINQGSHDNETLDQSMTSNTDVIVDNQNVPSLHRGVRRRCLDFETVAAHWKKVGDGSKTSSLLSESDEMINSKDKHLVPARPGNDSRRILPGIGLHLNALAITLKENNSIRHEILPSGSQQLRLPGSTASFQPPTTVQQPVDEPLTSASTERDIVPSENGAQLTEEASAATSYLVSEEFNHMSPRKKRRRTEHAGESDACKRCNCKKSKCLKLYCECFAAGVYCIEPCSCQECFNKPIHEDTVLATRKQIESRNPLAFAPKVIRSSESIPEIGEDSNNTPASARHKRGCNCKKSNCLKKYCECYQGGVGCSINCRCEGCKNAFGQKDGFALGAGAEPEEEDTEASEKKGLDKTLQVAEIQNDEQQNPSALPATPLQLSRPLLQLPFSSKNKPPPSVIVSGSTSQFVASTKRYGKPNILRSQPMTEKHCQTIQEDEIPEILRGSCSPSTGIKTASPNKKRVTPPYYDMSSSSSPGLRSGRKLVLQSIPSFPSLTPQQ
ncbi:Tesmin/TSO1-like CXC domain-containing protein putative isoform 1 [Tripterygium wilfordii]|uniref:Tesmin/TSO1-like CXC domain-containing protein putative isoform 1 n=1 Tax=Tripterygium wilfordii TaxID=458696 RepID=A0A7J7CS32_TRIWF|nr:protein tesmin/TSO1-like CXC 3 [Tripterygium wilfordii]KAF5736808.1 Tesmin/TSO1-like CXC domain-containing protein putative isoform 1 [Tripterygium wilfordii]